MAKICNAQGRQDSGSGYVRVLGDEQLGKLISKVQSTVISNGTELEKLIIDKCNQIKDLNSFIEKTVSGDTEDGVYVCPKKYYAKSSYLIYDNQKKKILPDLLIFIVEKKRICKVVELKDGDMFDTKKSAGEKEHLEEFVQKFGSKIPFVAEYYICCFNQENKDKIFEGFKGDFTKEHILTGKELCEVLRISYDDIIKQRTADSVENFEYFIQELLKIETVKAKIEELK